MQLNNSYLGYTDDLPPMKKGKVETILDKVFRYSEGIMSRKDFILLRLLQGNTLWEGPVKKWTENGMREKTEYQLLFGKNMCCEITKTEYDFGCYLTEKGLLTEDKVKHFLEDEQDRLQREEKKRAEAAATEQAAKKAEEKAQRSHEVWVEEQATAYANQERLELLREVFLHEMGVGCPRTELLVLIENIDNPRCRTKLQGWLHTGNMASRKVFECITGLKLPKNNKETVEFLADISSADYKGSIPYKPRKKPRSALLESFYIHQNGIGFVEVMGEPLKKYGLDLFIHRQGKRHCITDARSGVLLVGGKTKSEAMASLKEFIGKQTVDVIRKRLQEVIDSKGLSPKFMLETVDEAPAEEDTQDSDVPDEAICEFVQELLMPDLDA